MRCGMSVMALIAAVSLLGCGRVGGEPFQPTLNSAVRLQPEGTIAQTVNPADDEVSGVTLAVATFADDADPAGALTVSLRDPVDSSVHATSEVAGAELSDAAWVHVDFDPPAEVGDVVSVEVSWQGDTPLALWANEPQPDTEDITNDPYAAGEMVVDGQPVDGDLAFRITSPAGAGDVTAQAIEVARSAAARMADEPVFALVWGLAMSAAVALALWGLRSRT